MKHVPAALLAALLAATPLGGAAHGAHEHGVVKLDIAIEPARVTLQIESPLDNLIGFEHAPRNDDERHRADAAVATLKAAATLFRIDPAAGCAPSSVELRSPPLGLGRPEPGTVDDGHADLDGDFVFSCRAGAKAGYIDLALFDRFAAIQRIEVQFASARHQGKRTLTRPAFRVDLAR